MNELQFRDYMALFSTVAVHVIEISEAQFR